jgi:hypothetical protein
MIYHIPFPEGGLVRFVALLAFALPGFVVPLFFFFFLFTPRPIGA